MSVYFIVQYDIIDPEPYQGYVQAAVELLGKHNGEILAVDPEARVLEGAARGNNVILRFDSEEAAMGWYNDPAYVAAKKIRLDSTANGSTILVKQFVPPTQ